MANQKSAEYPVIEKIIYSQYLHPDVGPLCRPVKKPSDQLLVKLGLAMQNIINLDISTGVLTGTFFVHHSWTDVTIPSFSDAERTQDTVAIPVSKIWKPDIVLLNSVEIPEAFDKDALAVVKYTGDVLWCPRAKLAVQCKKTTSGDWQADFAFVSWVHDKSQLDLAINEMGFSLDFFSSDKYKVTNATAKRSEFNCPLFAGAPWVQVVYSMTIQVL